MAKARILLVDDEAIVRDSVSEWLRDDGYDVECAADGPEALRRISGRRFDTAVLDLKMPGMDGMEVMRRVKQSSPETVVIIITAYSNVDNAVEAMRGGASDYIRKPFTLDDLEKSIKRTYQEIQAKSSAVVAEPVPVITPKRDAVSAPPATRTVPAPVAAPAAPAWPTHVKAADDGKAGKGEKQCIWSKAGVVSYRVCVNNFKCDACEFAQTLMDKGAQTTDRPMMMEALKKTLEKPGTLRSCRYMLSGHVNYKICPNVYMCHKCQFNEHMEDLIEAEADKMAAKIRSLQERKAAKKTA